MKTGIDQAAASAAEQALAELFKSPKAKPARVSASQFFRENGTLLAAMRMRGWTVGELSGILASSGVSVSARTFSTLLSRNKPKGAQDQERALAAKAASARMKALASEPEAALPTLEVVAQPSGSPASPASQTDATSIAPPPAPIPKAEHTKPPVQHRAHGAESDQGKTGNASEFGRSAPVAAPPAAAPSAPPERKVVRGISLPGVVNGVQIDRTSVYERTDEPHDTSEYIDGKAPWEWLVEACALHAFNKSETGYLILRNGKGIAMSPDKRAKVIGGLVKSREEYDQLK